MLGKGGRRTVGVSVYVISGMMVTAIGRRIYFCILSKRDDCCFFQLAFGLHEMNCLAWTGMEWNNEEQMSYFVFFISPQVNDSLLSDISTICLLL